MTDFRPGEQILIKEGTFHNPSESNSYEDVTFYSYMAGREYAILLVKGFDGYKNIRVNVEDIERA